MYWRFTFAFFAWQQGDIGDSGLPGEKGDQGTKVTNSPFPIGPLLALVHLMTPCFKTLPSLGRSRKPRI